jgi:hypothetical protein
MTDELPETAHFGLTRIGDGEADSKNGNSFKDLDRIKLDDLIYAALSHRHDGSPALGDPTDGPGLTVVGSGGALPAATTVYYRTSFVDQWGLETAASPEVSITTPDPLAAPDAPGGTVSLTGGNISPGVYAYLITFLDAFGGETTPSASNNIQVTTASTNKITLSLPDLPTGAVGINVYRSRPGQSAFYLLAQNITADTYVDTGISEDQTIQAPVTNTASSTNTIQVEIPGGIIPLGCASWKIYRTLSSGDYDGISLVHQVVEGDTDYSPTPRTVWNDTGDVLLQGFPQNQSSAVPPSPILTLNDLQGRLPLDVLPRGTHCLSFFAPGVVTNGQTIAITNSPVDIEPLSVTAYFATPPAAGESILIRLIDSSNNSVDLNCPDTPVGSDPVGYYHVDFAADPTTVFTSDDATLNYTATIYSDAASVNGTAVYLSTLNDSLTFDLGTLAAGDYTVFFSVRPDEDTPVDGDLSVFVLDSSTNQLVASDSYSIGTVSDGYREPGALTFTAPGDAPLQVGMAKASEGAQEYFVDGARMLTTIPTLHAGMITVSATSNNLTAADMNLVMWF